MTTTINYLCTVRDGHCQIFQGSKSAVKPSLLQANYNLIILSVILGIIVIGLFIYTKKHR